MFRKIELLVLFVVGGISVTNKIKNKLTRAPLVQQEVFPSLENYEVGASPVDEEKYPWIARVIHSATQDYPHVCTAVCIDHRIFMTAARCIATLKLIHTTVIYDGFRLPSIAFVLPTTPTRQLFDDVGFIVVDAKRFQGRWRKADLYGGKRRDNKFKWFADLKLHQGNPKHVAVGYTLRKFYHSVKKPETIFKLSELKVHVGIEMCSEIFTFNDTKDYYFPCFYSCNIDEFRKRSTNCKKYHGAEGAALYNLQTKTILGIATWGASFYKYELPVGFSVPNSNSFYEDILCARKIRDYKTMKPPVPGLYQQLCDDKKTFRKNSL